MASKQLFCLFIIEGYGFMADFNKSGFLSVWRARNDLAAPAVPVL
jgi:hypothetical protein